MSLELIKNRQKELVDIAEAKAKKIAEHEANIQRLFNETGVPEIFDRIKDIMVPHWKLGVDSTEYSEVPLREHVYKYDHTGLTLRSKDGWSVFWGIAFDPAASEYKCRIATRNPVSGHVEKWVTKDGLRADFVDYMAKLLPPL